jgi:ATP-dependent 26S proteasome regulatory subunit
MTDKVRTRSEVVAAEVVAKLRARTPVMWIVTKEEARVERYLFEAAAAAGFVPRFWDVAAGVTDINGKKDSLGGADPVETIDAILARHLEANNGTQERGVWIMRDLPIWLAGQPGAATLRKLRNFARAFPAARESAQAIIIVSPNGDVPAELADHTTVIEWPMPDREEIASIIDVLIEQYNLKDLLKNGNREKAIDAAVGLSGEEAQACYSRSLVQTRTIDPAMVAKEKKRVIARERVLEWYDPIPEGLDAVGGLDNLKTWLKSRAAAYTAEARAYGLPRPKGTMLVGISGCGKSLTAKAIATAWQCPLLRVDLGALKSKFVGESEQNLRKVFKVIEALGFCVVWFDEVEKALQGATSGSADGGVSSDAMGAVLTWMQERTSDAFVMMTANDVSALPPEFLRKGRFDELWWIDLPNATERVAVLNAALRANGRSKIAVDAAKVAKACEGFTGSEIAAIVPDALFAAFSDGKREITTDDLVEAANTVTPLSKTADKKIAAMREAAKGRFRPATKAEDAGKTGPALRVLDIG